MQPKLLIVDDYVEHAENLKELLQANQYQCQTVYNARDALHHLGKEYINLILLDNKLPDKDGLQFVRELRQNGDDTPIIMYSAFGDSHLGSEAARLGVYDFLPKADDINQLYDAIEETIQKHRILTEQKMDSQYFLQKYNFAGVSPQIKDIFNKLEQIAHTNANVLITGETGVGKNLLAEVVHKISPRADRPFVWLDSTAIPESLMESTLFGHERGAFTGADRKQIGRLENANQGTLLLDQVDDLKPELQVKLLRFVETHEYEPLGSNQSRYVDVRIISTAMEGLDEKVRQKHFREDLFYRLAQIQIEIPPLRERKEDILFLSRHFLRHNCIKHKKPIMDMEPEALRILLNHRWPGNVRELQFFIERLVIFKEHGPILKEDVQNLPQNQPDMLHQPFQFQSLKTAKDQFERDYILKALMSENWNVSRTAEKLEVDRTNLYKKIKTYGIEVDR